MQLYYILLLKIIGVNKYYFFDLYLSSLPLDYADANQETIVKEGGLDALLMLLESSKDVTVCRVAAGAIANLAMNGKLTTNMYLQVPANFLCI